jgi:hypothetical protein
MVSKQWQIHIPPAVAGCGEGIAGSEFAKGRFYRRDVRAGVLLDAPVSQRGPSLLRALLRAAALLPPSRALTIELGSALLTGMEHLLPKAIHRQLLLTSGLMGMLDVALDNAAPSGEPAALRVASLTARPCPENLLPAEK